MKLLSVPTCERGSLNSSVELATLKNKNGLVAQFMNYGARWIGMWTSDRKGNLDDCILGFDKLSGYVEAEEKYHGAIVGRVCGRIRNAGFELNGHPYHLIANENGHHLHGGVQAFHTRFWKACSGKDTEENEWVAFAYTSSDGEEGYPGNLSVNVRYTLTQNDVLRMVCTAVCHEDTIINLTNHAFFNLCGSRKNKNIWEHRLRINASYLIECDEELIPTGKLLSVEGTPLDFRQAVPIGPTLDTDMFGICHNKGFSLAYAMDHANGDLRLAAVLSEPDSGRKLEIYTNQPSLQIYTGYCMDGRDVGKGGFPYYASAGVTIEPQGFPDAIHHSHFPTIVLRKGEIYSHVTEYRWSVI